MIGEMYELKIGLHKGAVLALERIRRSRRSSPCWRKLGLDCGRTRSTDAVEQGASDGERMRVDLLGGREVAFIVDGLVLEGGEV